MPWDRLGSLFCAAAIVGIVPEWNSWAYSLGLSHYLLAFLYAQRPLRELAADRSAGLWLPALVVVSLALDHWGPSLVVYFGLHHALNEAYAPRPGSSDESSARRYRAAAALWHGCIYAFVLRDRPELFWIGPGVLLLLTGMAGVALIAASRPLWQSASPRRMFVHAAPEWVAAGLALLSLAVPLTFLQVVLYHFLVWVFLPLPHLRSRGTASCIRYAMATIASTLLFFALSPAGLLGAAYADVFVSQFVLWSYVHITASFLLSDAQPGWIGRLTRPSAGSPRRQLVRDPR